MKVGFFQSFDLDLFLILTSLFISILISNSDVADSWDHITVHVDDFFCHILLMSTLVVIQFPCRLFLFQIFSLQQQPQQPRQPQTTTKKSKAVKDDTDLIEQIYNQHGITRGVQYAQLYILLTASVVMNTKMFSRIIITRAFLHLHTEKILTIAFLLFLTNISLSIFFAILDCVGMYIFFADYSHLYKEKWWNLSLAAILSKIHLVFVNLILIYWEIS